MFDHASVIELDSVVEELAEDTASSRQSDDDLDPLDQVFASL